MNKIIKETQETSRAAIDKLTIETMKLEPDVYKSLFSLLGVMDAYALEIKRLESLVESERLESLVSALEAVILIAKVYMGVAEDTSEYREKRRLWDAYQRLAESERQRLNGDKAS
jgi:hypothetical protein